MLSVFAATETETLALGAAVGRAATPGTVVALRGDLGAGKTTFARGVGRGLGVPGKVRSPTFILAATHDGGRLPLVHADLYRLGDADELDVLGIGEGEMADGVLLIEWAERFPEALPADHLEVWLRDEGAGRRIELRASGPRHAALVAAVDG